MGTVLLRNRTSAVPQACHRFLPLLAACAIAAPAPARADAELARSASLGATVVVAVVAWCSERPVFTVDAPTATVFAAPAFTAAMARFGTAVVAAGCAEAKGMELAGRVGGQPVWHGSAAAADGWRVQAAMAAAPLDLVAPPVPPPTPLTPARRAPAPAGPTPPGVSVRPVPRS